MKKIFLLAVFGLLILPAIAFSQVSTTSTTMPLKTDNGFSIGVYGGPNYTGINYTGYEGLNSIVVGSSNQYGYDCSIIARLKLKGGIFFYSGLQYEIQAYKISTIEGGFENPAGFAIIPATQLFPVSSTITFTYAYSNNYIGIPLVAGYTIAKKKWEFSIGLGVEYYHNPENKEKVTYVPTGQSMQFNFSSGQGTGIYNGYYNYFWDRWGAFGILNIGIEYKISRRFSVDFKPILEFTDPFAESPNWESVAHNIGQHTFSMDFGINYHFYNRYFGGDFQGKSKKWERLAIGFNIVPTYLTNKFSFLYGVGFQEKTNPKFSFGYAFTAHYDLTSHLKLETGIAIDNFNYLAATTNTLIGLPLMADYYFPFGKSQNSAFYLGVGCHLDYPTNIGWIYTSGHPFILPLALGKCGYMLQFGGNYFVDAAIGYEHSFQNIQVNSGNINPSLTGYIKIVNLPNYIFSTIGFGYKF